MDVLEKKTPNMYSDELKKIIKLLTFKKHKLILAGSASLKSQKYPADFDFMSNVPRDRDIIPFLVKTIKEIDASLDYYFVELKFQAKNKKLRFFPQQPVKQIDVERIWNHIDFIKLDMIVRIENRFTEVSVIYSFESNLPTSEEYKKGNEEDIKELKSEGNYYKVLKRQFNIYKSNKDKKNLLKLSKIFNGEMGQKYQLISNLEAIQKVLEYYQDTPTINRIKLNLKDLRLPDNADTEKWVKEHKKLLNDDAKKIYEDLKT
jgi:uncharacterized protein (UPF0335 family)